MINAFLILASSQLAGEILRDLLHLPLPGPVIGMLILAVWLIAQKKERNVGCKDSSLTRISDGLVSNMGVLFVPAGVGIISEINLIEEFWVPITFGVIISTLSGLLVTALTMQHLSGRKAAIRELEDERK